MKDSLQARSPRMPTPGAGVTPSAEARPAAAASPAKDDALARCCRGEATQARALGPRPKPARLPPRLQQRPMPWRVAATASPPRRGRKAHGRSPPGRRRVSREGRRRCRCRRTPHSRSRADAACGSPDSARFGSEREKWCSQLVSRWAHQDT